MKLSRSRSLPGLCYYRSALSPSEGRRTATKEDAAAVAAAAAAEDDDDDGGCGLGSSVAVAGA